RAIAVLSGGRHAEQLSERRAREGGRREAIVGVALRELLDDLVELGRGADVLRERRNDQVSRSRVLEVLRRIAVQVATPRAELPEHDAHGVEVDARVADLLPRDL